MKTKFLCNNCKSPIYKSISEVNRNKSGLFYCSTSCSAQVNNKTSKKRNRTRTCKKCNALILSNRTYCLKCYEDKHYLSHKTLADAMRNKGKDANRYTGIRGNARKIYNESDKPKHCAICGYNKHIEVCHIQDIAQFSSDTLICVINNIENLIALCPNHHWELDHGLIKVGPARLERATLEL